MYLSSVGGGGGGGVFHFSGIGNNVTSMKGVVVVMRGVRSKLIREYSLTNADQISDGSNSSGTPTYCRGTCRTCIILMHVSRWVHVQCDITCMLVRITSQYNRIVDAS